MTTRQTCPSDYSHPCDFYGDIEVEDVPCNFRVHGNPDVDEAVVLILTEATLGSAVLPRPTMCQIFGAKTVEDVEEWVSGKFLEDWADGDFHDY